MAYWGMAMSHWYPLWYPPNAAALQAGSDAVEKAQAAEPKTEREKEYVAAIAAFYRDSDKLDHRTRAVVYEKAMEQVYLHLPEDREAAVFYALALNATQSPTDKTFANKKKAAEILNKVWTEQPNHPGVVHYLIHSDDTQQLADAGLPAAMCYAKIAPAVPHALHMPSHIFTRLGLWQQSIDSNVAAHDAGLRYVQKTLGQDGFDGDTVHSMDYLEYAYLQTAQDVKAKAVVDELLSFRKTDSANLPMAYAVAAIPVRYALARDAPLLCDGDSGGVVANFSRRSALLALSILGAAAALGAVETGSSAAEKRVALSGYDPVSYFTDGRPEKGSAEYSAAFDDATYWFKNAEHRATFVGDPDHYAPQFRGYCAILLSRGEKHEADPEAWVIADGKLYVFSSKKGVPYFEQQTATVVEKATDNWAKLRDGP